MWAARCYKHPLGRAGEFLPVVHLTKFVVCIQNLSFKTCLICEYIRYKHRLENTPPKDSSYIPLDPHSNSFALGFHIPNGWVKSLCKSHYLILSLIPGINLSLFGHFFLLWFLCQHLILSSSLNKITKSHTNVWLFVKFVWLWILAILWLSCIKLDCKRLGQSEMLLLNIEICFCKAKTGVPPLLLTCFPSQHSSTYEYKTVNYSCSVK